MTTEELERKVARLIEQHVEVGYELLPGGYANPDSIRVYGLGAAHVVCHFLNLLLCAKNHERISRISRS